MKSSEEKRAILGRLLSSHPMVKVYVKDPNTCILPIHLRGDRQVALEIGYSMAIPIPDLDLGLAAWSGTLSFGGKPCWICIPWGAVFAYLLPDGRGVFVDSVPESEPAKVVSLCEYRKRKGLTPPK